MATVHAENAIVAGDRVKVVARRDRDRQPHCIPVGTVAEVVTVWKGQDAPYQLEGYDSCLMEDDDLEVIAHFTDCMKEKEGRTQ